LNNVFSGNWAMSHYFQHHHWQANRFCLAQKLGSETEPFAPVVLEYFSLWNGLSFIRKGFKQV